MNESNLVIKHKALADILDQKVTEQGLSRSGIDRQAYKKYQQFRESNVKRANDSFKVPVDLREVREIAPMGSHEAEVAYRKICSAPREGESWRQPEYCAGFAKVVQEVFQAAVEEDRQKKEKLATRYAGEQRQGAGKKFVGLHRINTGLEAALFVGATGKRAMGDGHGDWGLVASALHREGHVYDCMDEAEAAFIEYSKTTPGFKSEQDARQRFHGYDESQAKAHYTIASLVAKARELGPFRSSSPAGYEDYNHEPRAVQYVNEALGIKDPTEQRRKFMEPVFVAAVRACQIERWNELVDEVRLRAKALGVANELKRAVKELDAELGTSGDEETTTEKVNKWAGEKLLLAMDQYGDPVGIVDGQAFALNDGFSVVSALAKSWVSDQATSGKPFPQKSMLDLIPTWIAKASISGEKVTFAERWIRAHGVTYIDYHWCVAAVTKTGWEIIDKLPKKMYFRKTLFCAPLPQLPTRRGGGMRGPALLAAINKLAEVINLAPASVPVLAACLTYSIVHETGTPGVAFVGPSGSGKSFAAGTARKLIHPSRRSAESLPKSLNDMLAIVDQGLMTLFDNISGISLEQSDTWARFISEPSINFVSKRKLFTDGQVCGVRCGRIIWTTGIVRADDQADLRSRMIGLKVQALESSVQTEAELTARFDQYAPELMAALLDLCVGAWSQVDTYTPDHPIRAKISRLANFDMWLGACFEVLGLTWQAGLDAVAAERTEEAVQALQGHKYLCWLTKLQGEFVGTVSELSQELSNIAQASTGTRPFNWPSNKALLHELGKQQTAIIKAGFVYEELAQSSSKKAKKLRVVSPFGVFD